MSLGTNAVVVTGFTVLPVMKRSDITWILSDRLPALILTKSWLTAMLSSTSSVKHYSEKQIVTNTILKQSEWLKGDLQTGHKKTTSKSI